ncbi:MAG: hypothetical protein MJA83_03660 [Gammaproteobacteria bacterium]|nr:hypothetical protein [Gammaproteobacteria bacterium]
MEQHIYISWYGAWAVIVPAAWWFSRNLDKPTVKALLRTGLIAAGFTTVPVLTPDGNVWVPVALYYFEAGNLLRAAGIGLTAISFVWIGLFAVYWTVTLLAHVGRG